MHHALAADLAAMMSPADREAVSVFVRVMAEEYASFYKAYWRSGARVREDARAAFERFWNAHGRAAASRIIDSQPFASTAVVLSETIWKNGRGVQLGQAGGAIVPLPEPSASPYPSYFTAVHELTHVLSDLIVLGAIGMDRSSVSISQQDRAGFQIHSMLEAGAIVADFLVFQAAGGEWTRQYLDAVSRWVGQHLGGEADFHRFFSLDPKVSKALREAFGTP
ncbi:MAG: hypothetical protein NUW23_04205 [Firmicutes bacterium]|nr:hypothetical protein [Bacillota bacterium]